jgi:hypothetical protein
MDDMTWEQIDRIAAAQRAKSVEVVERLAETLGKEFNFDVLRFIWSYGGGIPSAILIEAFERARLTAKK